MGDPQADINDVYAFQNPNNAANSVLILTVNPAAGSGLNANTRFGTDVDYDIRIDNTGDSVADITYRTNFSDIGGAGVQSYTLSRIDAAGTTVVGAGSVGAGPTPFATGNVGQVTADVFDDPFFFDLNGFNDGLNFTGDDFFAGLNTNAIVFEVENAAINGADSNISVQGVTSRGGTQIDRIGRPGITTVLISDDARKSVFNLGAAPDDFSEFGTEVNAVITSLSDQANADALTPILLPDLLTFDTSSSDGFLNGRRLTDDVIDGELTLLTNSNTPIGDGVDANDRAFNAVFPFLATANPSAVPEPTVVIPAVIGLLAVCGRRRRRS